MKSCGRAMVTPLRAMAANHHAGDVESAGDEAEHLAELSGRGDVAHQHVP
jgi:hypothetical protein